MNQPTQPWVQQTPRSEEDDADERRTRSGAPEVRGDYSVRQDAERAELPNMTDDELEALFLAEYEISGLANPPAIPGWHLCWLTTSSQFDTIQRRQRVGYIPVMKSEMPGYDPSMGASLEKYEGMVTCNELVLHKIQNRRYQVMMNLFHHKTPLKSEEAILSQIKADNASVVGSGDDVDPGITMLERSVKVGNRLPDQAFH